MSEAAPQGAPGAATEVGGQPAPGAPEVTPQVAPTASQPSAQAPAGYVSEDRFNGLMSLFNKQQEQIKALQATPAPASQPAPAAPAAPQQDDLRQTVEEIRYELLQAKMDAARAEALRAFPEVAPFADLLQAETPQDIVELAQELSNRLKPATTSTTETAPETETPGTGSSAPVMASSTTYSPVTDDSIEALKADVRANRPGAFGKLMNALAARQSQQQ